MDIERDTRKPGAKSLKRRLFVALAIPENIRDQLAVLACDLPGADWSDEEKYHVTLSFIGEVDEAMCDEIQNALGRIRFPAFSIALKGIGHFPLRGLPQTLWVGVEKSEELLQLQHKVEASLMRLGLELENRKYHPHVTLAKISATRPQWLGQYFINHSLFQLNEIEINDFNLYSSVLRPEGSEYFMEQSYPLSYPLH